MTASISVTPRPYWLSSWLLEWAARPFVLIDGAEYRARWGSTVTVTAAPGAHTVGAGVRYRGFPGLLGVRAERYVVVDGCQLRLEARNGPFNNEPFYLTTAR